jgi:Sulfotransferase domain
MSGQAFPHKILWLASYPKSGNTWFRAFLTALMNEGELEINKLITEGIFSARETFDLVSDITSRDLYDDEAKRMVADVYRHVAAEKNSLSVIKVHDAFESDASGKHIVPEDVTHRAIYFIRNPLDVAGSLASHLHISIQAAVDMLNNNKAYLAPQPGNLNRNNQFRQHLSDWSTHVNSWTLIPTFPVVAIRYEDMLTNTFETFKKALEFIGWHYSDDQIQNAISATRFEVLSRQEKEKGFSEKSTKSAAFFRSGTMKNWEKELTTEQIEQISITHKDVMRTYQY